MKLTKLAAVNLVISSIGQSPVTTIDNANPMIASAVTILDEVTNSVQAEGWSYNTECGYPFAADVNGKIAIPNNVVSLDGPYIDQQYDLIVRGGFLYDKRNHSSVFTENLELDVVWLFEFEDLPEPFRQYIAIRSANLFAGRAVGSAEQVRFGEREEASARASILEFETQQGDYNMLGTSKNENFRTYTPFNAGYRY